MSALSGMAVAPPIDKSSLPQRDALLGQPSRLGVDPSDQHDRDDRFWVAVCSGPFDAWSPRAASREPDGLVGPGSSHHAGRPGMVGDHTHGYGWTASQDPDVGPGPTSRHDV